MIRRKEFLLAATLSALLLGGCFDSETGASQRVANGDVEKVEVKKEAPAKEEAKAETPAETEAPVEAEKTEAPVAEETAAPAEEPKAEEAPAKTEEPVEAVAPVAEEKAEAPTAEVNLGACKGCHGANFEKAAMGKSKVVSEMSKDDIVAALKGYKDGSYGGAMKGLMKGQVATLDDAAIEAMAGAIAK
ncbi:hypothetical protein [Sulfurovum sp. bin170]|uniref:c-type cytochrome n=1 Tax=Sulfurovum sp. bin170 TaxID=2695268 RepID=UPI00351B7960